MPTIQCDQDVLNNLCDQVSPSVVSVNTYETTSYDLDFATGFVIYSDKSRSLVCVHRPVVESKAAAKKKKLYVHFNDGTTEKAEVFLRDTPSGHAVLVTTSTLGRRRRVVSFSQRATKREEIFTIAEIDGGYSGFNFMTGTIINPSCKAIKEKSGKMVPGSKNLFAMSCGAVVWPHVGKTKQQIIGAAVFDLDGLLIGTIKSLDMRSYDLKFSQQVYQRVDDLEALLRAKDKKETRGVHVGRVTGEESLVEVDHS